MKKRGINRVLKKIFGFFLSLLMGVSLVAPGILNASDTVSLSGTKMPTKDELFGLMVPGLNKPLPEKWVVTMDGVEKVLGYKIAESHNWTNKEILEMPGLIIDSSNVDEVKDFLPPTAYLRIKDSKRWNNERFRIVPYQKYVANKEFGEATKKHSGQAKLTPEEWLDNWTAGLPFPNIDLNDPQAGIKIAWNVERSSGLTWGDDNAEHDWHMLSVDGRTRNERYSAQDIMRTFWKGRIYLDPKPAIPGNTNSAYMSEAYVFTDPPEQRGLIIVQIIYDDPKKSDDQWIYIPTMRRWRRMSTNQRLDPMVGTDITMEIYRGWTGKLNVNKCIYRGRQFIFSPRHLSTEYYGNTGRDWPPLHLTRSKLPARNKGDLNMSGLKPMEPINCYVVDYVRKDKDWPVQLRRMWIDPESYIILYSETFDQEGRLWKNYDSAQTITRAGFMRQVGGNAIDYQRYHGSPWYNDSDINTGQNKGVDTDFYDLINLKRLAH